MSEDSLDRLNCRLNRAYYDLPVSVRETVSTVKDLGIGYFAMIPGLLDAARKTHHGSLRGKNLQSLATRVVGSGALFASLYSAQGWLENFTNVAAATNMGMFFLLVAHASLSDDEQGKSFNTKYDYLFKDQDDFVEFGCEVYKHLEDEYKSVYPLHSGFIFSDAETFKTALEDKMSSDDSWNLGIGATGELLSRVKLFLSNKSDDSMSYKVEFEYDEIHAMSYSTDEFVSNLLAKYASPKVLSPFQELEGYR